MYHLRMGKKRPWCERAESVQAIETVTVKQTWKHAPRMHWGLMIQLMVFSGFVAMHAALVVIYMKLFVIDERQPDDPGFLSSALPVWTIITGICVAVFLFSLGFTQPGKARMKRALLPIRCQRCPKCFYDLSQRTRDDEICPECGVVAPRRECVRLWCKLLRTRF